jgi:lipopolysaccharide exporter
MFQRITAALARRHHVRAQVWQSLAGYTQTIGGMLMGVLFARLLSPEIFGQLAYVTATLTLLMIPFNVYATQMLVTDGGRTPELFGKLLGLAVVTMTLKLLVLIFAVVWYLWFSNSQDAIVAIFVGLPLILMDLFNVLRSDLEGRGRFKPNFEVQAAGILTQTSVSLLLVLLGWGIYGLAIGGFVGFLPQLYLYWKSSGRRLSAASISVESVFSQLGASWWLWLTTACGTALMRLDKIAVGFFAGDTQLGYYNRAINYSPAAALALWSLLTNATVVALKSQASTTHRGLTLIKISTVMTIGSVLNWAVLYFFSDPLVVWVFGSHWAGAIPVFQAFGWLSLAYAAYHLPATVLLAYDAYRALALGRLAGLLGFGLIVWWLSVNSTVSEVTIPYSLCIAMVATGISCIIGGAVLRGTPRAS